MTRSRKGLVKDKPQLAALASGARQEIVDVLPRLGTASVADLARALDRPPDSLYYHLRALQRVGLVVPAGHRRTQRRLEALYQAVAPRIELRLEHLTPTRTKAAGAIVSSAMRMGIRDYKRALAQPEVIASGPDREVWALRTTGWLTEAQMGKVIAQIRRLLGEVSRPRSEGRLFGLTLVFAPLHQRGRERIEKQ